MTNSLLPPIWQQYDPTTATTLSHASVTIILLSRLDIHPLVCNVEQVRVLRGLGAIQPGVNR